MKKLKVCSVKLVGIEDTFNLRMRGEQHNFALANGVISGNSHSVAYAYLTMWTAYLKANHPVHYHAAMLTHETDDDKIIQYVMSAKGMGIKILPPDINLSGVDHQPEGKAIRFGLGHIKGMPRAMAEKIVEFRDAEET
jgi:DNA polymerase-3 subunit alpha